MASHDETTAAISVACDSARQALGPLQQAQELLEQARAQFAAAAEMSGRSNAGEAIGQWSHAIDAASNAMQATLVGLQTAESHAAGT